MTTEQIGKPTVRTLEDLPNAFTLGGVGSLVWDANPDVTFAKFHKAYGLRFKIQPPHGEAVVITADPDDVPVLGRGQGEYPYRDIPIFPWDRIWKEHPEMPLSYTWMQGPDYKKAIGVFRNHLRNAEDAIPRFGDNIMFHLNRMMKRMHDPRDRNGEVVTQAKIWYRRMLCDACVMMTMGKDLDFTSQDDLEPEMQAFYHAVDKLGPQTLVCILDPFVHMGFKDESYRTCEGFWMTMYHMSQQWYDELKAERAANGGVWPASVDKSRSLFLDAYEDYEKGVTPENRIVFNNVEYVIGVMDPASQLMENILFYFTKYPDCQAECRKEFLEVFGSGKIDHITVDQWHKLKKLQSFIGEVCRMLPLFSIHQRRITAPTHLADGTFLPMGTKVIANYKEMCKLEKAYPDPGKFMPDRFLDIPNLPPEPLRGPGKLLPPGATDSQCPWASGKVTNIEAVCPFGLGVRSCAGIGWASVITGMGVALIIRDFQVSFDGPTDIEWKEAVPNHPMKPLSSYFKFVPHTK